LKALSTTIGDVPLHEHRLTVGARAWSILHTGAVLTLDDEQRFFDQPTRLPYGAMLWPSAIALAHDVVSRDLAGKRVLELGAGIGLPGLVAVAGGAHVVQTDNDDVALHVGRLNAARNAVTVTHRAADWTRFDDADRYDVVLGSDILYAAAMHEPLAEIFARNVAPGGRLLLADPLRAASMPLLERLESRGWRLVLGTWSVVDRTIAVYELSRA
jgi:methyltransferase-like protein 23